MRRRWSFVVAAVFRVDGTATPWQSAGLDALPTAGARRRQPLGRAPAGGLYGKPCALVRGCPEPILYLPCRAVWELPVSRLPRGARQSTILSAGCLL